MGTLKRNIKPHWDKEKAGGRSEKEAQEWKRKHGKGPKKGGKR